MQGAKELGVTYQHLWRVVVSGERKSESLLARYRALQKQQPATPAKNQPVKPALPAQRNPALENLQPYLFGVLGRLGIDVVIVQFSAEPSSPIWATIGFEKELGKQLEAAQAGNYDSSEYIPGSQWHFYHSPRGKFADAIKTLKSGIQERGLLETATIMHAEKAGGLVVYWPATAEEITLEPEA